MKLNFRRSIILFSLALSACGASKSDEQAIQMGNSQALNGDVRFSTYGAEETFEIHQCTPDEKTKILDAMALLKPLVVDDPAPLVECLRKAVFVLDNNSWIEDLVQRLSENQITHIACLGGCNAHACAPLNKSHEYLNMNKGFLANNTAARVATVIAHELMHNKGFTHPKAGYFSYKYTVPEQIERCLGDIIAQEPNPNPNGIDRGDAPTEMELARIGGDGGEPFELHCPSGSVMVSHSVHHTVGVGIDGLQISCSDLQSGQTTKLPSIGKPGAQVDTCPPGEVAAEIRGFANNAGVIGLRLGCRRANGLQPTPSLTPLRGNSNKPAIHRQCNADQAIIAVLGTLNPDGIGQLRYICRRTDTYSWYVPSLGAKALSSNPSAVSPASSYQTCRFGGALSGLYGRSSGGLQRLGGVCRKIVRDPNGLPSLAKKKSVLPAYGAYPKQDGPASNQVTECPSGELVVGITVQTSATGMSWVQGHCAAVGAWHDQDPNAMPTTGPSVLSPLGAGVPGATEMTIACPPGQFIHGLGLRNAKYDSHKYLDELQLVCRSYLHPTLLSQIPPAPEPEPAPDPEPEPDPEHNPDPIPEPEVEPEPEEIELGAAPMNSEDPADTAASSTSGCSMGMSATKSRTSGLLFLLFSLGMLCQRRQSMKRD
jgi:hypothetical protein